MIGNSWDVVLKNIWDSKGFWTFYKSIEKLYDNNVIYPEKNNIFAALKLTPYEKVKVVIIGQDPYHGEKEAHGLSFSVQKGVKIPPSLKNIYKELSNDLGINNTDSGDLTSWTKQGVLLLNSVLTVEKDKPNSHKNIGWELFTNEVIKKLNMHEEPIVFILWGNFARSKKEFITNKKHLILESAHPSPFSANYGFFGSKPFSKTNEFLINNNYKPIDWKL